MTRSSNNVEENIYEVDSDVKETFNTSGHGKKVQSTLVLENTAITGAKLEDVPIHKNISLVEMAGEVHTNPMYLQTPVSALSETNEIYSDIADVTESDTQ